MQPEILGKTENKKVDYENRNVTNITFQFPTGTQPGDAIVVIVGIQDRSQKPFTGTNVSAPGFTKRGPCFVKVVDEADIANGSVTVTQDNQDIVYMSGVCMRVSYNTDTPTLVSSNVLRFDNATNTRVGNNTSEVTYETSVDLLSENALIFLLIQNEGDEFSSDEIIEVVLTPVGTITNQVQRGYHRQNQANGSNRRHYSYVYSGASSSRETISELFMKWDSGYFLDAQIFALIPSKSTSGSGTPASSTSSAVTLNESSGVSASGISASSTSRTPTGSAQAEKNRWTNETQGRAITE